MFRLFALCAVLLATPLCAATFNVTNLSNSGAGSLRQAILDHNSTGGTNAIDFTASGTVTLSAVLPTIAAGNLTINAHANGNTVSGGGSNAIFAINSGAGSVTVTFNGLTISNGATTAGSAIQVQAGSGSSTLNLDDCTISGNNSGAVLGLVGSTGTVTMNIDSCTVSGNTSGPALTVAGGTGTTTANITNSTFSGNSAPNLGGGIAVVNGATVHLVNCTITNNAATNGGGGVSLPSGTGCTLTLRNTIVAGNSATTGPDINVVSGNTVTSNDGNLIGVDSGFTMTALGNDLVGTSAFPIDPLLDALADNGGPTQTHALLPGSWAINAGVSGGPSVDQRGIARGALPDIGAYEVVGTFTVTNLNDSGAGSLRQAILDHNSAGGINTIDFIVSGTVNVASSLPGIFGGDLTINAHASGNTLLGSGNPAILYIDSGNQSPTVTINGLTITNSGGSASGGTAIFVGVFSGNCTLNLNDCTISGNNSTIEGAVHNDIGGSGTVTMNIDSCTFSSNTGGGALAISGGPFGGTATATITNSTFSGNSASSGAAIAVSSATADLVNCTITNNTASTAGGGAYLFGSATLTLQNTIIAGNTAPTGQDINMFGANTVTSNDGNLIGVGSGFTMAPQSNDQLGTVASPLNPMLAALANNGGSTQTHALQPGSPAIDAGAAGGPSDDQRGTTRDANPDIGACEYIAAVQFVVTYNSGVQTSGASNALTPDVAAGTPVAVTVNLANIGSSGMGNLTITLPLTVSGETNCTATVTTAPSATIAAGANSDLVLTITSSTAGAYSVTLTIVSSDAANSPFNLTFTGNATASSGSSGAGGGGGGGGCAIRTGHGFAWLALLGILAALGWRARRRQA